jgi:hypothetical protein
MMMKCGAVGGVRNVRENESFQRKLAAVTLFQP